MEMKYIFLAAYIIIFILALCVNIFFLAAVLKNEELRSPVYMFLGNQTLADLIILLLSFTFAGEVVNDGWMFNQLSCKIFAPLTNICYTACIFSATAVAVERYQAICLLSKAKRSPGRCVRLSLCIWIASGVLCCPLFYVYAVSPPVTTSHNTTHHVIATCRTTNWSHSSATIFHAVHAILAYAIPLTIMAYTHVKISRKLFKTQETRRLSSSRSNMAEETQSCRNSSAYTLEQHYLNNRFSLALIDMEALKNMKDRVRNKNVIHLLITVTAIFLITWSPLFMGRIVWTLLHTPCPRNISYAIKMMILSSTAVNFFVYLRMSPVFRKTVRGFFRCNDRQKWTVCPVNLQVGSDVPLTITTSLSVGRYVRRVRSVKDPD